MLCGTDDIRWNIPHKEIAKPLGDCQVNPMPHVWATIFLCSNLAQQWLNGRQNFEGYKNVLKRLYWAIMSCLGILNTKPKTYISTMTHY